MHRSTAAKRHTRERDVFGRAFRSTCNDLLITYLLTRPRTPRLDAEPTFHQTSCQICREVRDPVATSRFGEGGGPDARSSADGYGSFAPLSAAQGWPRTSATPRFRTKNRDAGDRRNVP